MTPKILQKSQKILPKKSQKSAQKSRIVSIQYCKEKYGFPSFVCFCWFVATARAWSRFVVYHDPPDALVDPFSIIRFHKDDRPTHIIQQWRPSFACLLCELLSEFHHEQIDDCIPKYYDTWDLRKTIENMYRCIQVHASSWNKSSKRKPASSS